jgi:hypothetical protein
LKHCNHSGIAVNCQSKNMTIYVQCSMKLCSFQPLLKCFKLLDALASICLILSLLTSNLCPASSRGYSRFNPIPNRILRTFSSLLLSFEKASRFYLAKWERITASWGEPASQSALSFLANRRLKRNGPCCDSH